MAAAIPGLDIPTRPKRKVASSDSTGKPKCFRTQRRRLGSATTLDFYLPGDFDDVFRSKVETVDDLH